MREEFGNCLFLVQNHVGRGTVDPRRAESQVVDRPLSLLSWIVVFFIVMKGIQSSGKVRTRRVF